MKTFSARIRNLVAGSTLGLFMAAPVLADDAEIYLSQADVIGATPNVLFIFDTSGSMDTLETSVPIYKPSVSYAGLGTCQTDRIYFSNDGQVPNCGTDNWFPVSSNTCPSLDNLDQKQGFTTKDLAATQLHGSQWEDIKGTDTGDVRCNGVGSKYKFYSGNYLNYWVGGRAPVPMTRTEIVREVALSLTRSLDNVKLGLMRYDSRAQGGMVLHAIEDINTSRASITATLDTFTNLSGNGNTPLSETLYEAALYMQGRPVDYGNRSAPVLSVASSREPTDSTLYKSPIEFKCQKSYIVYLTDGEPTSDNDANSKVASMIGKQCQLPDSPVEGNGTGRCTDEIAEYMHTRDLSPLPDTQTASTYMIGFGSSVQRSLPYLDAVALAGGTSKAYTGTDVPSLTNALQEIFEGIQQKSQTFVTPAVSVNAFNRTQTESDLYFSLFEAADAARWPGNLKKYKLQGTQIVDALDRPAVDTTTGFFAGGTTSIWSVNPDGADVKVGGAVSLLPDPPKRNMYTYLGGKDLSGDGRNNFDISNTAALTDIVLTLGTGDPTRDQVINWARGYPSGDSNRPAVKTIGDPMHGQPAVVTYAQTSDTPPEMDTVVFVPTNDGFLHAFTGKTNGGGQELWAFIPPELLGRLKTFVSDRPVGERTYGLDGDVRVLKFDANRDGIVNGSDKVWIFFGMRSGGTHYYGLDVTVPTKPQLLWNIGPAELPGVGETWSPPVVTRVNITGTPSNLNSEKFVLIFGGGYDRGQENQPYQIDSVGKRIFMVDAETGDLLWYAGDNAGATLQLNSPGHAMNNSIPARIAVLDTNGDQFADRMYAGDMGGRIWRFDIFNGNPASSLVTGGIIATLGAGNMTSPPASTARRFYNAPDIALISRRGQDPYYNISIGSGYRGHPLDTVTDERFYAVRDKQPFAQLDQSAYDRITPVVDNDLVDITTNPTGTTIPATAAGWKLRFNGLGHSGEKVLAEATTVSSVVLFPTFDPGPPNAQIAPCYPTNVNRAYAISIDSGRPALDFNDTGAIDNGDLSTSLTQQGIVGQINVAVLNGSGTNTPPNQPPGSPTVCIAGVEVLKKCVGVGGTVRTFWNRNTGQ